MLLELHSPFQVHLGSSIYVFCIAPDQSRCPIIPSLLSCFLACSMPLVLFFTGIHSTKLCISIMKEDFSKRLTVAFMNRKIWPKDFSRYAINPMKPQSFTPYNIREYVPVQSYNADISWLPFNRR
ncbi:hypothetical protein OIU85_000704 [Salix viminalis]|uniref:Uncharacterized protein n=1 Tax=Salix viminalis TaxID=40686 RepID=A0A9Q0VM77_SALVM|nr:hypothetical protein OIU85_000704 [Salix viminalis]